MDYGTHTNSQINHSNYLQCESFGSLNGLRAIAILAVLWHHFAPVIPGWELSGRGFLGVDLFFIISGFLIAMLLLREQRMNGVVSLRDFYIRRFLRIFPPYYLMLFVVGSTALLKPGNTSAATIHDFPFAALYLSNLVPMSSMLAITWSLSVEEQFYLIVPTLEKYAPRVMPILLPTAYILVSLPPFRFFPTLELPSFFRQTTFGPIILGVILAHLLDDPRSFSWIFRGLAWRLAPVLALALMMIAASYPAEDISGWQRLTIHWTMLVFVASCVIRQPNALQPILSLWLMRRIGIVSYGMYLYQHIVGHFIRKVLEIVPIPWPFAYFVGTVFAVWAVAECSFRYFETPFLTAKERFAPKARRDTGP
jgi:peptidoglycan/LPS O-acetylase OafA/YrhL